MNLDIFLNERSRFLILYKNMEFESADLHMKVTQVSAEGLVRATDA